MLTIELPCGHVFGVQRVTPYRPLVGVECYPKEISFWLFWLVYRFTWYSTNRRGVNEVQVNLKTVYSTH